VEQEDKYTEILVEKIMSLKPDIILVGRSVARRAQEILCSHNVVVMQSVKASLLERVSRMTGALMLPSTDHMIQRYGENCLGSCGRFWLRKILDNEVEGGASKSQSTTISTPTRTRRSSSKPALRRITNKQKCTTYAYLEGCPPELGCTLILRGANRQTLVEIKRIIKFSVMLAYHLRLEVAYYSDRCGRLPLEMNITQSGYESEDDLVEEWRNERKVSEETSSTKDSPDEAGKDLLEDPIHRSLLSTSFDVDIKKPFQDEVRFDATMNSIKSSIIEAQSTDDKDFASLVSPRSSMVSFSPEDHQTLLVTSLLMTRTANGLPPHGAGGGKVDRTQSFTADSGGIGSGGTSPGLNQAGTQRSRAEVKGIRFYTNQDVALGQFLVESCFQMHDRINNSSVMMMDHTLSFIHRPGRIDISVSKVVSGASSSGQSSFTGGENSNTDMNHGAMNSHTNSALANLGVIVEGMESDLRANSRTVDPLKTPIYLHSYCKECKRVVTPTVEISDETWKLSFGKFIEINFYNHSARCRTGGCTHFLRDDHVMSFTCEGFMAQFEFVPIHPLSLHPRTEMPLPMSFHSAMLVNVINECVVQASRLSEEFSTVIIGLEKIVAHVLSNRPEVLAAIMNDIQEIQQDIDRVMDEQADEVEEALQLILHNKTPRLLESGDYSMLPQCPNKADVKGCKKFAKAVLLATYPLTLRREMLMKSSLWNGKIKVVYSFIDAVEGLNTAPSAVGGTVEVLELPDEDDLMIIRNTVMGKAGAQGDLFDREVRSSSSATNRLSINLQGRNFLDSPRQSVVTEETTHPSQLQGEESYINNGEEDHEDGDDKANNQKGVSAIISKQTSSVSSPAKDKSTRLAKAIQRFRGKDDAGSGSTAFAVGVDELCQGRLGLPAGRLGRVIAVHEEQLASVIAYSLASDEYYDSLQLMLAEDSGSAGLHGADSTEKKRFKPFSPSRASAKQMSSLAKQSAEFDDEITTTASINSRNSTSMKERGTHGNLYDDDDLALHDQDDALDNEEYEEEKEPTRISGAGISTSSADSSKLGGSSETAGMKSPSGLETINEDKTLLDNMSNTQVDRGNNEDDEDDSGMVQAVGHKSYKFLNFNYNDAMKLEGLSNVGNVVKPPGSAPSLTSESSQRPRSSSGSILEPNNEDKVPPMASPTSESTYPPPPPPASNTNPGASRESTLISQRKTHIKHRFNDVDQKTDVISCKFICHIFYATQFRAVREEYLKDDDDDEGFIRSLSMADQWNAQGGKSGASFSKSSDSRFVVKHITRTELQMFLDFAPAYFEYLAKSFYHGLPTLLVKILGVYQLGYHNRLTGKRVMEQVVIMENLFYDRNITRIFDLKGSSRQRYVDILGDNGENIDDFDNFLLKKRNSRRHNNENGPVKFNPNKVCMDDNLMELTKGKPLPLKHKAKVIFHKAVMNDTLFLSIINIVDYSILVGIDEDTNELVVGIIDYMRQYDIIKRMERMGKSVGTMIAGQAEPTVIQPPQYRKRFQNAMERYFMTVPDKWIQNDI